MADMLLTKLNFVEIDMRKLSIVMRSILTVAFVAAGVQKLFGSEMMVEVFAQLGFGQWFRIATGSIEVGAALLLWLPGWQAVGAALLGGTMVGAVLAHFLILGPSVIPGIILGLICSAVLFLHKDQIHQLIAVFALRGTKQNQSQG